MTYEKREALAAIIGGNIRAFRKKRGMTIRDMAQAVDISYQAINGFETGGRCPSGKSLESIAEFFDTGPDRLKDPHALDFGNKLRIARRYQHMLQQEFADMFGITVSLVTAWECGRRAPTPIHWRKLEEYIRRCPYLKDVEVF